MVLGRVGRPGITVGWWCRVVVSSTGPSADAGAPRRGLGTDGEMSGVQCHDVVS